MPATAISTSAGLADLSSWPFEPIYSLLGSLDQLQNILASLDLTFDLTNINLIGQWLESHDISGKYKIILSDIRTLNDLTWGCSVSIAFGIIFSIILYNLVLPGQTLSLRKLIIGSCILLSSGLLPYLIFDMLDIKNTAVRFTICTPFVLYGFRTLEAIFSFVPAGATTSFKIYCQYFSAPSELVFDKKSSEPVVAMKSDYIESVKNVMLSVLRICVLVSFLSQYNYKPFSDTDAGEFFDGVDVTKHLNIRHLGNCFFIALFFQQALALGDACIGLAVQMITGYKVLKSMHNPMLEATSPSDFWGRRWNLIVHSVMKRGVYKPVRKYLDSTTLASLMVFIASGLFHEWLVHAVLIFQRPSLSENVYLGSNSAFFLWNFKVIMFEKLIAGSAVVKSIGQIMPGPLLTFSIVMSSLPVAHWFGNPYLNGGFFSDYEDCIIKLQVA